MDGKLSERTVACKGDRDTVGEAAGSAVSSDAAAGSASLAATAISADFPTDRNRTAVHMMAIIFFRIFGFVFIIRTILFL